MSEPTEADERATHPDYRFSLANERTLLAWLRTSLALVVGALAVAQFVPDVGIPAGSTIVAVGLLLLAIGMAVGGHRRYLGNEQAIAAGVPLPSGRLLVLIVGGVVLLAVVVGALFLVDALSR